MMPVTCVVAGRYSCVLIWMNGLWQFQENTRNHHGREVLKSLSNKKVKKPRHIYLSRSFHDSSKESSSLIPRWICPSSFFFFSCSFFFFAWNLSWSINCRNNNQSKFRTKRVFVALCPSLFGLQWSLKQATIGPVGRRSV